jgi:hypothetical protein
MALKNGNLYTAVVLLQSGFVMAGQSIRPARLSLSTTTRSHRQRPS